ncbi:hypothetical protein CA2559_01450 [Croceibacter atlanticus HTCC2559]|jgi:hypothetical protein|uniref:Outer membrane protein beta-barrel domain-containing protein n=2 Tax=Croceibacter TaxID=216431 RepID=A3U562_CROAH|nr:hypothetical protein CA2559_01450 [Croceibacter atlanticus HTCC2559]
MNIKKYNKMNHLISNKMRGILVLVISLNFCYSASSQEIKGEIIGSVSGVFSTLDYSLNGASLRNGKGGQVGVHYGYHLSENYSLQLGLEFQSVSSSSRYEVIRGSYNATDSEGEDFEFRYRGTNFQEQQKAQFVSIPLVVQYETSGVSRFYIAVGGKVALPIDTYYETDIKTLNTSGFYRQYNVELFDPEFAGFGTYRNINVNDQDLELKTAFSATLELGIKQMLSSNNSIYIGLFFDYGINDLYDGEEFEDLVNYSNDIPSEFTYNTILGTSNASEVKLNAYGVKLKYSLGI